MPPALSERSSPRWYVAHICTVKLKKSVRDPNVRTVCVVCSVPIYYLSMYTALHNSGVVAFPWLASQSSGVPQRFKRLDSEFEWCSNGVHQQCADVNPQIPAPPGSAVSGNRTAWLTILTIYHPTH